MKNLTIKSTPNHSAKTFTIRKYDGKTLIAKYRTVSMSQRDFEEEQMNSENDWKHFLRNTNDYYKV